MALAALSGQKAIATAGTELALGATTDEVLGALYVKALPANTGVMYVGRHSDGSIASSTGYPLKANEYVLFENVGTLSDIMVDATVNGEGVAWLRMSAVR